MYISELNNEDNGYVKIKLILHEIYNDSSHYNKNGISWQEPYVSQNLQSAIGSSITVEFTDDERTQIWSHGETGSRNGILECSEATVIGNINKAYIEEIIQNNMKKKYAVAEGKLDYHRYADFIDKYREEFNSGLTLYGSVEIVGTKENNNQIIYKNGYEPVGRIPTEYAYCGFALLGSCVNQADDASIVVELNSRQEKTEEINMTEMEKALADIKESFKSELNATVENQKSVKELQDELSACKKELEGCKNELEACKKSKETAEAKLDEEKANTEKTNKEINEYKSKEMCNKLDTSLKDFSKEDIEFVSAEVNAFKENPVTSKVSVEDIVNKLKVHAYDSAITANAQHQSETNAFKDMFLDLDKQNKEDDLNSESFKADNCFG